MKIYTTEKIRQIFDRAQTAEGITALELTDRAAEHVADELITRWPLGQRFVFFAGPGGNGADALAVARLMAQQGYRPQVYLFNIKSAHLSPVCSACRDRLLDVEGVDFVEVSRTFDPPQLGPGDVVVDGLFGTGLTSPLRGGYAQLVQMINSSHAYVVSLDMPSGLFGEWNSGSDRRNIICADLTLTYRFKRLAFYFAENAPYVGRCEVLDVELDADVVAQTLTDYYLVERDDVHDILREREPFTNKYDNGALLLVAGSYGMMGAAVLAARGALRAGAGLVTVHAPICGYEVMQTAVPEAIFEPDPGDAVTTKINIKHAYSVVAIGPGLGTSDETLEAIDKFLKSYKRRCLFDADALNCISRRGVLLRAITGGSIITPHAAEFDRLFGQHNSDEERLKKAIDVSKLYTITIVLKSHFTMVVRPDGKVYVNSSGNPGMATAGSGDVLTGVIASLLGQGYADDEAVVAGVFIHGMAGDIAAEIHSEYGVMASDIAANIGRAIRECMRP